MTQQTVLVTGATSGIGAEVARQMVARGHRVFGTSRNPDAVADPIPGVTYVRLDNADYASADACAAEVGAVDILINNAGESQAGALEDTPMSAIEDLFRVNVFGPIALTKAVLPGMRERRRGTVIMVGSMLSSFPVAFRSNYAATKSALKAFALASRRELAPYGIRVISVEPGTIATGIGDRRSIYIGDDSPYKAEYQTLAAATRRNEDAGISGASMAEQIVEAALAEHPKPFYARGNRAPIVFALRRLLPRQFILDMTARKHGLAKIKV
ncbi:short-chain dehydrogenase/reductase SDR [Gordonia bronchialis DSM 43247]|uniref:Short-chain dehydrogenase/reductase SDR n=1 Tax=Gordonia bronchialis (strain ATCC 25592 / DSM 43247 / BCRC 13721 / JCM 3198 / KCTC 3076 / NBRC 16047 / NCTC 10667) TaxID=526226 RepID=D0L5S8_GORB4|nr:SDR family oxidoreductase [Gordonia bronchialis]ACY20607.1 short-chain dehydrogenase/reductase SDR [Gordonia bronchialis DSM 43247]MCC3323382.1 SDR family oxidoreductase [Gordonia bronchialis]QGS25626.1 SDR family NAD(P)-dependent oxidoreductase [Gordonia bronchialis]STQ63433.1 NADP-dependent 3-hydroxy acid dehydrogenase YdfG [Gordonia bronchialis]